MQFRELLLVFIGGGGGALCRYGLARFFLRTSEATHFPWGTFLANALGCFLVGVLAVVFLKNEGQGQWLRLLFITGFAGGFTTFSTFSYEALELIERGFLGMALTYMLASLLIGLLLAAAGAVLMRILL